MNYLVVPCERVALFLACVVANAGELETSCPSPDSHFACTDERPILLQISGRNPACCSTRKPHPVPTRRAVLVRSAIHDTTTSDPLYHLQSRGAGLQLPTTDLSKRNHGLSE